MRVAPCEVDDEGVGQDAPGRRVATLRDVLTRLPQGANAGELTQITQGVQAGRASPRLLLRRRALEVEQCLELLTRPLGLALRLEVSGERVTHLDEPLHVERRIDEPIVRQGARRPVDRRVLLRERHTDEVLGDGGEADARQTRET